MRLYTFAFNFLRRRLPTVFFSGLMFVLAGPAIAATGSTSSAVTHLRGSWCLTELDGNGIRVPENIEVQLLSGGRYRWMDGAFVTEGRWDVDKAGLFLSSLGQLPMTVVGPDALRLEPPRATWYLQRGRCSASGVSQQDVAAFHSAAGRGDLPEVQRLLSRGLPPDVQDFVRGDTALILAAKFCRLPTAQFLLEQGASKSVRNLDGLTAFDYTGGNAAYRACAALQSLLR